MDTVATAWWSTPWEFLADLGRICLALLISGVLGMEREAKGRAAGLRTHMLVCLGATVATMITVRLGGDSIETGRVIAGVLTGVGFLGAGTIVNIGSSRLGLTTAATIWFVAVLGVAVGTGNYGIAVLAGAVALGILMTLENILGQERIEHHWLLNLQYERGAYLPASIEAWLQESRYTIRTRRVIISAKKNAVELHFDVTARKTGDAETLVTDLETKFDQLTNISCERVSK